MNAERLPAEEEASQRAGQPSSRLRESSDSALSTHADPGLTPEEREALECAQALAEAGVPIFVARPNPAYGSLGPDGRTDERLFIEPSGWQNTVADPSVVYDWEPGWMLAAVTGVAADVIDTDPRNGGNDSRRAVEALLPTVFAVAETQQGGTHEWVARLHRGKKSGHDSLLPGLDVLAGDDRDQGRAYVRIPPTTTPLGSYKWKTMPDMKLLAAGDIEGATRFVDGLYDPIVRARDSFARSPLFDSHELSPRELSYLSSALDQEVAALANQTEPGRNTRLNLAAFNMGQLVAGAGLDEATARASLREAASKTGLTEGVITATLNSGMEAGKLRPRSVPSGSDALESVGDDSDLVDLVAELDGAGDRPEPPSILRLVDGTALLYAGRVNALIGAPESGKTWLAMAAAAQVLEEGGRVLHVDLEDFPNGTLERFKLLGVGRDLLAGVAYSQPDSATALQHRLHRSLDQPPTLVIVDSMGPFLAMLGAESNSNDAVTDAVQRFLRPLADAGSCVLVLDHVVKAKDDRGRYALGSQAKLATISGANYVVEATTPFARGTGGKLKITVTKDRPGHVRGRAGHSGVVGMVHVRSEEGRLSFEIHPETRQEDGRFRPTILMERVSCYLDGKAEPVTQNQIEADVTGKASVLRKALQCLLDEGHVELVAGGRYPRYTSVTAFHHQEAP